MSYDIYNVLVWAIVFLIIITIITQSAIQALLRIKR